MTTLKKIFCSVFFLVSLTCCNGADNSSTSSAPAQPTISSIGLSDITITGGCLNIPRYSQEMHELNPSILITRVTTNATALPVSLRQSFITEAAYAAFQFTQAPVGAMIDFDGYTQTDCTTLLYKGVNGAQVTYTINDNELTSLSASAPDGSSLKYTWLSPTSVQVEKHYPIQDIPCTAATGLSDTTTVYDWSGSLPAVIPPNSPLYVNQTYLQLIASANGYDATKLYEQDGDNKDLIVANVEALSVMPIQSQLLACPSSME
jgi:hypothetical protein